MPSSDDFIADYRILRNTNIDKLSQQIQAELKLGWQPYHGPITVIDDDVPVILQTIVRRGESSIYARDMRMEGVHLLQKRLVEIMRGGEIDAAKLIQTVLEVEKELEDAWKKAILELVEGSGKR